MLAQTELVGEPRLHSPLMSVSYLNLCVSVVCGGFVHQFVQILIRPLVKEVSPTRDSSNKLDMIVA
jgi:hypothetical protein